MTGRVTISIEIELAWGLHDRGSYNEAIDSHSRDREKETETLRELLKICDTYRVRFSFDAVGHLFYEWCSGEHNGPHSDDWFGRDPGTDVTLDPCFYAPDIVDMIQNSAVDHEICTHTFSHVPCGEVSCNVVDWELQKVKEIHAQKCDRELVSFVPPRHSLPPKDVLRKNDIEIIREPVDRSGTKSKFHTLWRDLFERFPVTEPVIVDGVVETYSTYRGSLNADHLPDGEQPPPIVYRILPVSVRKSLHRKRLKTALEEAIQKDSYVHLWTHLRDISNPQQLEPIKWFIEQVANRRDEGEVEILTMRDLNATIREHAQ